MNQENKHIVLIEDDETLSKTLAAELQDRGYKVEQVYDGKSGLKLIKKLVPDLVLLDLNLPKKHGLHVIELLRANEEKKISEIPVIILTVQDDYESYSKGMDFGAISYIIKSNQTVSEVVDKVDSLFQNSA